MATETTCRRAMAAEAACVDGTAAPSACRSWISRMVGNQIFWLVVALVVIYFVLSRIALPRIAAVLAERQGTITNDIAAAEDLKRQGRRGRSGL